MNQSFSRIWIMFITAVFLASGFLVCQTQSKEKQVKAPREQSKVDVRKEEVKTREDSKQEVIADDTANWKTYRNEEYGFEVKYPIEATVAESGPAGVNIGHLPFAEAGTNLESKKFDVLISGVTSNVCIGEEKFLSNLQERIGYETVNVSGRDFKKYIDTSGGMQTSAFYIVYFARIGDKCFSLSFGLSGRRYSSLPHFDTEKESEIFHKMISTFRFIH